MPLSILADPPMDRTTDQRRGRCCPNPRRLRLISSVRSSTWHLNTDTHRIYDRSVTKKLVHHGNSAALILDKPILDLLNVGMDTPLEITTDGRNIVISPATSHTEDEFLASLDKINLRFSITLERLAK